MNRMLRTTILSVAAAGAFCLAGCLASPSASRKSLDAKDHPLPSQNADLPYQFNIDGFTVRVSSPELTTDVSAWGHTVNDPLAEDERWLNLDVNVAETTGQERRFPWITMVRVRTALDEINNASHGFSEASGELVLEERVLAPNSHEALRYFFRVRRGDFPISIVFADGAAAPLGH